MHLMLQGEMGLGLGEGTVTENQRHLGIRDTPGFDLRRGERAASSFSNWGFPVSSITKSRWWLTGAHFSTRGISKDLCVRAH